MDMGAMTTMPAPTGTAFSMVPTNMPKASNTGGMGGMDMGMGGGSSCKISMLWNWHTIDSCFLSRSWHIRSHGAFAGSCIGTILLVICLEFLRRLGREYDIYIMRRALIRRLYASGISTTTPKQTTKTNIQNIVHDQENPARTTNEPNSENNDLITPTTGSTPVESTTDNPAHCKVPDESCSERPFIQQKINALGSEPYRPSPVEQFLRALLHMLQFAVAYFVMLLAMYYNGYIIICIFIGAFLGSFVFSWEPVSLSKENDATTVTKCCG